MDHLDRFTRAYIEAALWSSNDESDERGGVPLNQNYSESNIADECLSRMIADCASFQKSHGELITDENLVYAGTDAESRAGHDFWLTRCGHGAGFWDGDWTEPAGAILTKAAKEYGEFWLYVDDDGQIYGN